MYAARLAREVALVSVVGLLPACISSNPATGRAATGEPLRVKIESGSFAYTTNDVVGTSTIHDSNGNEVGTIEHHADREHTGTYHYFNLYEGSGKIDEQDFYRLAGDRDSVAAVGAHRASSRRTQWIGLSIAAASLAIGGAMIAGGIASNSTGLAIGGLVVPLVAFSPGILIWKAGRDHMTAKAVSEEHAVAAADLVERCINDRCATAPGEHRFRVADEVSELPPPPGIAPPRPAPAPPPRPASLIGRWRGRMTIAMAAPGESPRQSADAATFEIEGLGADRIVFWPDADQKQQGCRFLGKLQGMRAMLEPTSCNVTSGGQTTAIVVHPGGTLELRNGEVVVDVAMDVTVKARRGKPQKATVVYRGSGAPVP